MKITDTRLILIAIVVALALTCSVKSSKTYILPNGKEVHCRTFKTEGAVVVLSDCDDDATYLVTPTSRSDSGE